MVRKLDLYVSLTQSVRLMAQLAHNEAQNVLQLIHLNFSYLEKVKRLEKTYQIPTTACTYFN